MPCHLSKPADGYAHIGHGSTAAIFGLLSESSHLVGPRIAILENVSGCMHRVHANIASTDAFQAGFCMSSVSAVASWVERMDQHVTHRCAAYLDLHSRSVWLCEVLDEYSDRS